MKNISLLKIAVALTVLNTYLLTCTVAGTVTGSEAVENVPPPTDNTDDEANGVGTQDFLVPTDDEKPQQGLPQDFYTISFGTTPLAQKPYSTTYTPSDELQAIIDGKESSSGQSGASGSQPVPSGSSTPQSTPTSSATPPSSSTTTTTTDIHSSTTTTTTTTSTTTTTTTVSSETPVSSTGSGHSSSTPVQPPSQIVTNPAENEILTVNNGGEIVSGKALDIISKIVQNEIGATFAPEAIKAQAVAAYTHVKYNNLHNNNPSVRLADNVSDSVRVLTASVIGQAVYYNGDIIQAVYSASSAGYTASSGAVWGNPLPYLQCVYCELDAEYDPNYGKTKKFTSSDIKSRIYSMTGISLSGNPADWIKVVDYVEGKYVGNMTVGGYDSYVNSAGKTIKITGRIFRERIMSLDIRSSAFDVSYDAETDEFTFTTYGYGHGVGLSQNGANNLAKYWAWDYRQILEFYYQGTVVR